MCHPSDSYRYRYYDRCMWLCFIAILVPLLLGPFLNDLFRIILSFDIFLILLAHYLVGLYLIAERRPRRLRPAYSPLVSRYWLLIYCTIFALIIRTNYRSLLRDYIVARTRLDLLVDNSFYQKWNTTETEMIQISFFNITNANELMDLRRPSRPKIVKAYEIGPFVFQQKIRRYGQRYSQDGKTLTFDQKTHYQLDRNRSNLIDLEREIMIPNFALIAALSKRQRNIDNNRNMPRKFGKFSIDLVDQLLSSNYSELFIRIKPSDIIFGFEVDPVDDDTNIDKKKKRSPPSETNDPDEMKKLNKTDSMVDPVELFDDSDEGPIEVLMDGPAGLDNEEKVNVIFGDEDSSIEVEDLEDGDKNGDEYDYEDDDEAFDDMEEDYEDLEDDEAFVDLEEDNEDLDDEAFEYLEQDNRKFGFTFSNKKLHFSLYDLFSGTLSGPYSVYSGQDKSSDLIGRITKFYGMDPRLANLKSSHECPNRIDGNDLRIMPFDLKGVDRIEKFLPSSCRSFQFDFDQMVYYKDLYVRKYRLSEKNFQSPKNFENICPKKKKNKNNTTNATLSNGLIDLSECYGNIPLFLSLPYFIDVDPSVRSLVQMGSNNSAAITQLDHSSYLLVSPLLGTTLYGAGNIQLSLALSSGPNSSSSSSLSKTEFYIPFVNIRKTIEPIETIGKLQTLQTLLDHSNRLNLFMIFLPLFAYLLDPFNRRLIRTIIPTR